MSRIALSPPFSPAALAERGLSHHCTIAAPKELVWAALADLVNIERWWAPQVFSIKTSLFSLVDGGQWRFNLRGSAAQSWDMQLRFREIRPLESVSLICSDGRIDDPKQFEILIHLRDQGAKTEVGMHALYPQRALRDYALREEQALSGIKDSLDRLDELVNLLHKKESFVISKAFASSAAELWRLWTEPALMAEWWGPAGTTSITKQFELAPGGSHHYAMVNADGTQVWGKTSYWAVKPSERLVFLNAFANSTGTVIKHPGSPSWPLEILSIVDFKEHGQHTTVTILWLPWQSNAGERLTFAANHPAMRAGWTASLAQLSSITGTEKAS